jgi:poly(3-hydroxybutyrate) depolymerase
MWMWIPTALFALVAAADTEDGADFERRAPLLLRKGCTAVPVAQCGTKIGTNTCLRCAPGASYDCEVCCPGLKRVSSGGYHFCQPGKGPPPPPPAPGGTYLCYQGQCYAGKGTQSKAQCESACGAPPPPPGPSDSYICYQGKCFSAPGKGKQSKAQCDATCQPNPPPPPTPGISRSTSNLTWAGKERIYMSLVPVNQPATGLIVAVDPVTFDSLDLTCPQLAQVAQQTGAVVVCPAALSRKDTKGGTLGACWKAWGNYGTCGGVSEDSEDVDFLAALIRKLIQVHMIPPAQEGGKILMSGMSNGGSMAYRFNCERSELIGGLAIQSQAYFDPYVGFYDYQNNRVPTGTPQCKPTKLVPFYSDIGTNDVYYGPSVADPAFQGHQKWLHNFSTTVLGCSGAVSVTTKGPHEYPDGTGPATCYQFASCPGITGAGLNRFCSVPGMGHDASGYFGLLPAAFADFFNGSARD